MSPAEIQAAILAYQLLEPEVQRGISALIHLAHHKKLTAQDYLDQAAAILGQNKTVTVSFNGTAGS